MRVTNTPARWVFCFLVLPAAWLGFGAASGLHAALMVPAAVVVALLSAATAYRSGRGSWAAAAYFVGTALMMLAAFMILVAIIFTISCEPGETEGAC